MNLTRNFATKKLLNGNAETESVSTNLRESEITLLKANSEGDCMKKDTIKNVESSDSQKMQFITPSEQESWFGNLAQSVERSLKDTIQITTSHWKSFGFVGSIMLLSTTLSSCAWWQAGIHDPGIVANSIATAQPYQQVADAVYPKAGIVLGLILIPLLILLGGRKKEKE